MAQCSAAVSTVGCQMFIDKLIPGTADQEIKGHVSISFSGSNTSEIDATSMCDTEKQFMLGLVESGTVSIGINANFHDAGQKELRVAAGTDVTKTLKIDLANGDSIKVVGKVKTSKADLGIDAKVTGGFDLRLTARPTVTPDGGVEEVL
jgi:hypothetical protein